MAADATGQTVSQTTGQAGGPLQLRLRSMAQLFHTLDPSPFRESDLAPEAVEYILGWAAELPAKEPIRLAIRLPAEDPAGRAAADVEAAIAAYFTLRAQAATDALRELFRNARRALLIGVAMHALCTSIATELARVLPEGRIAGVVAEGFVIISWVVLWRPAEMFLYDWLPIVRRRALLRRLARAEVSLRYDT